MPPTPSNFQQAASIFDQKSKQREESKFGTIPDTRYRTQDTGTENSGVTAAVTVSVFSIYIQLVVFVVEILREYYQPHSLMD